MNLQEQNRLFEAKYLSKTDNVFEGINNWARDANKIYYRYGGRIDKKEALTAAVSKELPKTLDRRKLVKDVEAIYVDKYIREVLTQIDDEDIKQSVLATLNASRLHNTLTFRYISDLTNNQRARVRIICNIVWNNLYPKKG